MLSEAQFGKEESSMPLSNKFDGPKGEKINQAEDAFAANSGTKLPYPGFGD